MKHNMIALILSHGRPNKVLTLGALEKSNYKGDWLIVCDNEDETIDEYVRKFGEDKIVVFDKLAISKTFDTADNFSDRRTIVYARNASFDIADKYGYDYFWQLDDDYTDFSFRFEEQGALRRKPINDLDVILDAFLDFMDSTNVTSVAFAQGGDFIGGVSGGVWKKGYKRKVMNSFLFRSKDKMRFVGRINEDVNTYTKFGDLGHIFLTNPKVMLNQLQTQSNNGGMTDVYLDGGTYLKSFYSVLFMPSAVSVSVMGTTNKRLHHHINWNACVPMILRESVKIRAGDADG